MSVRISRSVRLFALLMVTVLCLSSSASARDLVKLTMRERVGLARKDEPITIGVPLPEGLVKSVGELTLKRADGRDILAEVRPVVMWKDGSLRWVHLYFMGDCPASGKASVTLVQARAPAGQWKLRVQDRAEAITVVTGPLKFVVRKKGFNLIDSAWVDSSGRGAFDAAHQVIAPHTRGGVLVEGNTEFTTASDPDVKVVVEESGPLHVVIKATGAHKNADASEKRLDFVARIYAYNNSPVVRLTYTFIMAQGSKRNDHISLTSLNVELPTTVKAGQVLFGAETEEGPKAGKLAADEEAFVYVSDSDTITYGGAVSGSSQGKSIKSKRIGWADLSDGSIGLAAGVRWFWQMHPKSVELFGDGVVRIGLYPGRHGKAEEIYSGVARTHYLQLVFHEATDAARLAGQFAGMEDPLRPFAPTRWYCQDTWSFGKVVNADLNEYELQFREAVKNWDACFDAQYQKFNRLMDGRRRAGMLRDDYGLLVWGDNFHWALSRGGRRRPQWNGNYYGYPHMMALHFIRTGKLGYFDHFESHALHVADVHTAHYDPEQHWVGASRYCPPVEHVRIDSERAPVYISHTFYHHKAEGIFARWYFLADHRMLDVLDEIGNHILTYKEGDRRSQPRGSGNIMIEIAKFVEHTAGTPAQKQWLERGREVLEKVKYPYAKERRPGGYQTGLLVEGQMRFYENTGDAVAMESLTAWGERFKQHKPADGFTAYLGGFMYARTGDREFLDLGVRALSRKYDAGKEKDFASAMRAGPYLFYYLSKYAPAPPKGAVTQVPSRAETGSE